jgi:hypothetical protein
MHFFFRQVAQIVGDIFIGNFFCLFQRQALYYFSQRRRRCNRAGTPESLEFGIFDALGFIQFEGELQCIAARQRADFTDAVRLFKFKCASF